jgi:hypothetical protein
MTDQQINAAIAAHFGITRKTGIPDFSGDLNEMHETEMTLTDANMFVMAHHIERLVSAKGQHYFHATARQRAEAFLRTLGKWEEVQG